MAVQGPGFKSSSPSLPRGARGFSDPSVSRSCHRSLVALVGFYFERLVENAVAVRAQCPSCHLQVPGAAAGRGAAGAGRWARPFAAGRFHVFPGGDASVKVTWAAGTAGTCPSQPSPVPVSSSPTRRF